MRKIKAITFDLDETLWSNGPVIDRADKALHKWLGERYPLVCERYSIEDLRVLLEEVREGDISDKHDRARVRQEMYRRAGEAVGYRDEFSLEAYTEWQLHRHQIEFFDEVLESLERLSKRYTLAALTNGTAEIHRLGLDTYLSFYISPRTAGAAKPERKIFEHACSLLEVSPGEVVHVGDHPDEDMRGAQEAGLHTVWMNRFDLTWDHAVTPDAMITDLRQLERLLEEWENNTQRVA